jgi:hypothetical protein
MPALRAVVLRQAKKKKTTSAVSCQQYSNMNMADSYAAGNATGYCQSMTGAKPVKGKNCVSNFFN